MQKILLTACALALSISLAQAAEPMSKDGGAMGDTHMDSMAPKGGTDSMMSDDKMMHDDKMGAHDGMKADDKMMHDDKMGGDKMMGDEKK